MNSFRLRLRFVLAYLLAAAWLFVPVPRPKQTQTVPTLDTSKRTIDVARRSEGSRANGTANKRIELTPRPLKADKTTISGIEEVGFDSPDEAAAYFLRKRAIPSSKVIPWDRFRAAEEKSWAMPVVSTANRVAAEEAALRAETASQEDFISEGAKLGTWTFLGPGNVGGRTRALVIHPTNPSIMWAGGAGGGVWKTTNGGSTWTALDDRMANLSVNSIAIDPADPQVLYAGTGEGFYNVDAQRGNGIFKSIDGGNTWTQLPNSDFSEMYRVNKIVVSKLNSARIYAATRYGLYRSVDAGATWTKVLNPDVDLFPSGADGALRNGGCSDIALRTDQSTDYLFVSCGGMGARDSAARIYRSTDASLATPSWTTVLTVANQGRTSLAISPSVPSTVYALMASIESGNFLNGFLAVYRSTSNGDSGTWTKRAGNTDSNRLNQTLLSNRSSFLATDCGTGTSSFSNQGWYDNVIAVDPLDSNVVWVGGIDLFRSDDGGLNFGAASFWELSSSAHADNHAITFHPQYNGTTNQTMYVGNDGGLFRTTNARAAVATVVSPGTGVCARSASVTWTALNNSYGVTQFYHGAPYASGTKYLGGTQDNGTVKSDDSTGTNNWFRLVGGDGGYVAVDPSNNNIIYAETQNFGFVKTVNGASFANAKTGFGDSDVLFITPFAMDPNDSQTLWTGGSKIWRTNNGASSWTQASANLPFAAGSATVLQSVSAVAIAPGNSNLVLIGTDGGLVLRNSSALSATSSTTWASSQPRSVSGFISSVAFDPVNTSIVYATISSYSNDVQPHVFRSVDGGVTWSAIEGSGTASLPDAPAHVLVVDPTNHQRLYLGTDLGVFVTDDSGATWARENTGFANVIVESLGIQNRNSVPNLFAFTHGRGAWRVPLSASAPFSISISSLDFGRVLVQTHAFKSVTITNNTGSQVSLGAINVSGTGFSLAGHNCPSVLALAQSCVVTVDFQAQSFASSIGNLAINSSAAGSPHQVGLSATGVDIILRAARSVRPSRGAGATISKGESASYEVQLDTGGADMGRVEIGCTSLVATCSTPPSVNATGSPVPLTVKVALPSSPTRSRRLGRPSSETVNVVVSASAMGITRTLSIPVTIQR